MKHHGIDASVPASEPYRLARLFTKYRRGLPILLAAGVALVLGAGGPLAWADDGDEKAIPFAEAHLFFELNNTDGDLGIHALIDGEPWEKLEIEGPNENRMLVVGVKGRLQKQGLTELFFESAEPPFDELAPEEFFKRFPAGTYEIEGKTLDGRELESEVELTHVLPAPPNNIMVSGEPAAENCDTEPLPTVDAGGSVTISWDPVTASHPELGTTVENVEIVKYQFIVEREEPELLVFSVDLPPSVTEFEIPSGFIALGEEFKFEILVREASGNQTAVESCFVVE